MTSPLSHHWIGLTLRLLDRLVNPAPTLLQFEVGYTVPILISSCSLNADQEEGAQIRIRTALPAWSEGLKTAQMPRPLRMTPKAVAVQRSPRFHSLGNAVINRWLVALTHGCSQPQVHSAAAPPALFLLGLLLDVAGSECASS